MEAASKKDSTRTRYHHGNAREALIRSAGELLESAGVTSLSLRSVAERAGLSRQAPYNHFADKEAMLAALVEAGYNRLAEAVGGGSAGLSGEVALAGTAEAYIAFAQDNSALFRLMFASEIVDVAKFPDAAEAAERAYGILVEVVKTLTAGDTIEALSMAAWCLVHGYATLCNEAKIEPSHNRSERSRQFAHLIAISASAQAG